MQGIKSDAGAALGRSDLDQVGEIREIANSPVAVGDQTVELRRKQPQSVEVSCEGPRRRNEKRCNFDRLAGAIPKFKPVATKLQCIASKIDGCVVDIAPRDDTRVLRQDPRETAHRRREMYLVVAIELGGLTSNDDS